MVDSTIDPNSTEDSGSDQAGGETQSFTPSPAETPSYNPNWKEALDVTPPEFHPKLAEVYKRWDENHSNSLKKWEPYKEFEGVDPSAIRNARNVWDAIATDPVGVYQRMGETLRQQGLLHDDGAIKNAQQAVNGVNTAPNQETISQNYGEEGQQQAPAGVDPVLAKRLEQLEQFAQFEVQQRQQQIYQQETQAIEDALVKQLGEVEQKYGTGDPAVDDAFMKQVVQRLGMAHNSGSPITPEQAAQQIQTYNDQVIANHLMNKRIAPRVVPANGGIPAEAAINPADMTPAQSKAYGEWIAKGRQGALNL